MRAVVTRVNSASVTIDGEVQARIGKGLLVLLGVHREDTEKEVFEDENGKMNLSPDKVQAEMIIVSQFTLFADCRSRRPGFSYAARPETAIPLYEQVVRECRERGFSVQTGVFAAEMMVDSQNDGPVTILLDTNEL